MNRHTIEVGWDYEVSVEEVAMFRDLRAHDLEGYYGVSVEKLTDRDVAKYMVRISHPSSRYLKVGQTDLVFHD